MPAIFWSIVALLWALVGPWAQIPAVIVMGVYFWLSLRHGQFYGHKVEGRKPSFLKDLIFLLIGPFWVLEKIRY